MLPKRLSSVLRPFRRDFELLLLLIVTLTSAGAQTTEGSIRGYIRDEQGGALPGVRVTAQSAQSPTPLMTTTDREGQYRLLEVPPGEYQITSEMQGFEKLVRANIIVHAGLNLSIDMSLQIGALSQTVTVKGDAPLLETKDAGQSVSVTGEQAQSLPLGPQKHWSEFIRFTPGAVSRDATNNQAPVFYIHGSGIVSSSTLIDGADMTSAINPWLGYTGLPSDTVADVQLKTSGVDASAPLGMGLAANVITKTGTNSWHGSATFTSAPGSWVGNNVNGGTASSAGITQPEAAIGGPILKDRAWFFGSYRYRGGFLGINRPATQVAAMQALDPTFKPFNNEFDNANIFFLKGNVQLNPKHQLSTFYNHDSTPYGTATPYYTGAFSSTRIGGDGYAARITSAWNSWLLSRATFSWNNKSAAGFLTSNAPVSQNVFQTVVASAGQLVGTTQLATLGNAPSATQSPYSKWTITGDVTAIRGAHELQAGVFLQPHMVRLDTITYVNGGNSLEEYVLLNPNNLAAGTVLFHKRAYAVSSGVIDQGHFSDNALYAQDSWRATPRLTVNAGVRFDHVGRYDDLFKVQLQNSWEIGPRVGVNYLITTDARHAVRASYIRLADAATINAQSASGSGTQGSSATTIGYTDSYAPKLDGNFSSVFVTPSATAASPSLVPDPGYHQPYVDEFAAGYRRQFHGELYFDVGYIERFYRDRTALVEQNAIYNGNVFAGYKNVNQNAIYLLTNNKWNWPVYQALEFIAAKQTSRLQILGSYTQVFPHLAGGWQPNDPASFIQPTAFPLNRGLLSNDNRSPSANNGLDITSTGTSSIEWTQQIGRANVVYHAPWSFLLSGSYTYQSGHYSGPVFTKVAAPDPQFGPTTVTLSNGRVVTNPLATTARFAFPTRSDGQFELPAAHYINLRAGRDFRIEKYTFAANLDVFNVPNFGNYQSLLAGSNLIYSSNYGLGGEVQPPRSYQLEFKFQF